ncbi:hypothetical protein BH09VER1_BH09VER1_00350 [soil metagenome]
MSSHAEQIPLPDLPAELRPEEKRSFVIKAVIALAIVGLALGLCLKAQHLNTATEPGVVMELPKQVGNFFGTSEEMSAAEKKILPEDTQVIRKMYENVAGDKITCSIVLAGGEKRSIHRAEICLPAQGWTIDSHQYLPITLKSGKTLEVKDLNLARPVEVSPGNFRSLRSQFVYWYIGKDRTTASAWTRILETSWDRVFKNTNHRWAYVIVTSLVTENMKRDGKTPEETAAMLEKFIKEIVPSFQKSEMSPPPKS